MTRGRGSIQPRAATGYTSLSVTKETRELLEQVRNSLFNPVSFDELLNNYARSELGIAPGTLIDRSESK